jgi:predicted flap endonuclease-1-like 5' DNA nuclease
VTRRLESLATVVGDRLGSLEQRIGSSSREPATLGPVVDRLASLERAVAAVRVPDLGPIEARLDAVMGSVRALGSGGEGTAPDLGWVDERMGGLERQVEGLRGLLERMTMRSAPTVVLAGSRNLLRRPVYGAPDDLKRIRGIGAGLERLLHRLGVFYFWQIAEWDKSDVRFVDAHLEIFKGRIERDQWVEQARELTGETGSAARPESLDSPPGPADA